MKIIVHNNYGKLKFSYRKIVKNIQVEFYRRFNSEKSVSLILVNNYEIQKLNKEYRFIDDITDVLSFPDDEAFYLGEVFVSIDQTIKQANDYHHSIEREFAFLITHGLLHLLGYNHEFEEDKNNMFSLTEEILQACNYRRI